MLCVTFDQSAGLLTLEPHGPLTKRDFEEAASIIDPYIEGSDTIAGLMIKSKDFPGWDSFEALVGHLQFVRKHHHQVRRVAIVTDSVVGTIIETLAGHFVAAEVEHFEFDDLASAKAWITTQS